MESKVNWEILFKTLCESIDWLINVLMTFWLKQNPMYEPGTALKAASIIRKPKYFLSLEAFSLKNDSSTAIFQNSGN